MMPMVAQTNFLEDLPSTAETLVETGTGPTMVSLSGTTVTATFDDGTSDMTYQFASALGVEDRPLISSNNNLAVYKLDSDNGGINALVIGTNVDGMGTGTTAISRIGFLSYAGTAVPEAMRPSDDAATAGTNEAEVTYSGEYIIGQVGTTLANSISTGTFTIDIDFAGTGANGITGGMAMDSAGNNIGSFLRGRVSLADATTTDVDSVVFTGAGDFMGDNFNLSGSFYGNNAATLVAAGESINADDNGNNLIMGIVGNR